MKTIDAETTATTDDGVRIALCAVVCLIVIALILMNNDHVSHRNALRSDVDALRADVNTLRFDTNRLNDKAGFNAGVDPDDTSAVVRRDSFDRRPSSMTGGAK